MASERLIKRRIRSAKNIAQITRAMQLVAASKMKKAQALALTGRPYAMKIAELINRFAANIDRKKHPLLALNQTGKTLLVLITTNKGLCGGLNTNLFRSLFKWFDDTQLKDCLFVTVGKKGENFLVRGQKHLLADFSGTVTKDILPALTTLITDGYVNNEFREVILIYNNFISALVQQPEKKAILPIGGINNVSNGGSEIQQKKVGEYLVEPSVDAILDALLFHYLENQIRDALFEAEASEHSARMMAMKNATDNAMELIDLLSLEYNKARQEKITYEIADIVTARISVD